MQSVLLTIFMKRQAITNTYLNKSINHLKVPAFICETRSASN